MARHHGCGWWLALSVVAALGNVVSESRADVPASRLLRVVRPERTQGPGRLMTDGRGRLPLLVRLPSGVRANDRGLLPVAPGFGAIHLTPAEWPQFVRANPDLPLQWAPPRRPLLDMAGYWTLGPDFREETGLDGTDVVVGVIDTGLDVTHPDFRHADGSTRVAWLLLGDSARGLHPELEQRYGCTDPSQRPCAILDATNIDELLTNAAVGDEPSDGTGHGTHVASIAAGNGGTMLDAEPRFVGMAPAARLIIAAPSSSGEFSDPSILNATRFIFEQADAMNLPAVVNISLGSDFGPHDGTSSLEQGLTAMVGEGEPGRAIVVAAGNSGDVYRFDDRGPFGVHTEVHVSPNAVSRVPMTVPGYEGVVSGSGYVWITFQPGDDVAVGLEGPDGEEWVSLTDPGDEAGYESDDGEDTGGVVNNRAGGATGIPTGSNGAVVVFDGSWEAEDTFAVLLQGHGHAQLWVTGTGELAPGLLSIGLSFEKALKAGTIGVPGSHPELISVGCTLNRTKWRPWGGTGILELGSFGDLDHPQVESVCYFSGAGPTAAGVMKPDLVAPGAYVSGAMSRDADPRKVVGGVFDSAGCPESMPACHVHDEGHALTSGTSMAAPHVAGAIALLFQRDPSLTQPAVHDLLQAGAHYPRGIVPYDYQLGPGALDLLGTLQVLQAEPPANNQPDPAESYYVLSSPYARPDPDWPVVGVVQVRTTDGEVAIGAGGEGLTLHVDGGLVVEAPTRVQAATWRFAIAAPRGSGGTILRVDVRYRGVSLGTKALPIGPDAWSAESGVTARGGGCGCVTAPRRSVASSAALALVALALAARGRRRASPVPSRAPRCVARSAAIFRGRWHGSAVAPRARAFGQPARRG